MHQSQLQNQMSQLNIGSILAHNNWSHRQNEDNWSSHIQGTGKLKKMDFAKYPTV